MSRTTEINLLHSDISSRGALTNLTNQSTSSANSSAFGLNISGGGGKASSDWGSREGTKTNTENILTLEPFVNRETALKSAPPTALPSNLATNKSCGFNFSDK